MTRFLSCGNENGLAPGGLGFDLLKIPANATLDATVKKHGSFGARMTSSGAGGPYRSKTVNKATIVGSVYYTPKTAFGSGSVPIWRGFIAAGSPGKWIQIGQKNSGKLSPSVFDGASSTTGADSTTTIVIGTTYLIDFRFDCSGTTWTLDYKISDTTGTQLQASSQITLTGRTANVFLEFREGPDGSTNSDWGFDDSEADDNTATYPIGAHTSDDTEPTGASVFPPSWLDDTTRRTGGLIAGFNCPFNGTYPAPYPPVFVASEGASKGNRLNYLTTIDYTQCTPPANLYAARQCMNGNMFGDPRVVVISGLGFDGFTLDWPAGGCTAFTSGSMDSTLDAWVALFLTLPNWPFYFRLWREMNSSATIYGANGAGITPNAGLNETSGSSGTYVTAYRYVSTYLRSRVPNLRMMWDPQTGDGAGGLASTAAIAAWYPGDAYVDANAVNAYVAAPSRTIGQALANFVAGFGMASGSTSRKPAILCETQVDNSDAARIADFQQYTSDLTSVKTELVAVNFWDSIGGQYEIKDAPAGYLAAFQVVVGGPPFDGVPQTSQPATLLPTQQAAGVTGLSPTYTAASATNAFVPDDRTFLHVLNTNASARTVTVGPATVKTSHGQRIANMSGTIAATTGTLILGPFPADQYADATTRLCTITPSATAGVTYAVVRVGMS